MKGFSKIISLAVGATSDGDGRLEVFALSRIDNSVWHRWQTYPSNGWSDWAALLGSGSLSGGEILLDISHSFGDQIHHECLKKSKLGIYLRNIKTRHGFEEKEGDK
jgi:hypothetical protein